MTRTVAVLIVSVAGCHGGRDTVDTETVDTDPPPALEGQIRLVSTVDGAVTCDIDVDFFSTGPYVGDCDGCDFAFEVDSTVIGDEPYDVCRWRDHMITYGLIETPDFPDRWLSFTAHYGRDQGYGNRVDWYNTLYMGGGPSASGFFARHVVHSNYGDLVWDDDWGMQGTFYNGLGEGAASLIEDNLSFAGNEIRYDWPRHYSEEICPFDVDIGPGEVRAGEQTGLGDVACKYPNLNLVDVWEFELDAAGRVDISLDTTGESFVPRLEIVDPTGCQVINHSGGHECTGWNADSWPECRSNVCTAWTLDVGSESAGTLLAIVGGSICCATSDQQRGAYRLDLSGAARPGSLRLAHDDAPEWTRYELQVTGSARLSAPAAQ
jgi:hypothetical protein